MKVIVYPGDSGNVHVITPVYPSDPITPEQEEELLKRIQDKDVPEDAEGVKRPSFIKDAESTEIIKLGTLFDTWKLTGNGDLVWDRELALELKRKQFRTMRKSILERLDVEFMRGLEAGDTARVAEVTAKKKELRDVTLLDLSQYDTPEKLNDFIPEVLIYT